MSGALLQLAALGTQDVYLSGNPDITLFKSVYKKYTHFSMETLETSFNDISLNKEDEGQNDTNTFIAEIESNGDLLYKTVLVLKLKANSDKKWGYVKKLGHAIIDEISISIGQTLIDTHSGEWIENSHVLSSNTSHIDGYNKMIGNIKTMTDYNSDHPEYTLYIPLSFWFTKSPSSSYPICTSIKDKIIFRLKLKSAIDIINYPTNIIPTNLPEIISGNILTDIIYLDSQERNLFCTKNHEYLIEQVQILPDTVNSSTFLNELSISKPCKYLVWNLNIQRYFYRNKYLSWAYDNDWDTAKINFGKLIYLVTRDGLNTLDSNNPYIVLPSSTMNIGEGPLKIQNGGTILNTLAAKIDGLMLFADTIDSEIRAKANINNVVLTKNEITFEDMSQIISELSIDATSTQIEFLNINTHSIINIFNYGNFINESDNPIVESKLQLNGKDKFKSFEGKYFNYVQPHYYFTNIPKDGLNVFSFCLQPESEQASGIVNFDLATSQQFKLIIGKYNKLNTSHFTNFVKNAELKVYAVNYTILKISPTLGTINIVY
jgi:hypothetical protein